MQDDELEDDFFDEDEVPEFITFNTFLPSKLQEKIGNFSDFRVQIFSELSDTNLRNLKNTGDMR